MYEKVKQNLAKNSMEGGMKSEDKGSDQAKLAKQSMPNTRMHDYSHNEHAGAKHVKKGK